MSEDLHRRAERLERLMIESRIGPIPDSELWWLDAHPEECARCAALARATEKTVQSLRSVPVSAPPSLVAAAQFRVHQRARELRRRQEEPILAWLGAALSFAWIGMSGGYVWRGLEWAAGRMGIPNPIWQMAFGLWWAIPALAVAGIEPRDEHPGGCRGRDGHQPPHRDHHPISRLRESRCEAAGDELHPVDDTNRGSHPGLFCDRLHLLLPPAGPASTRLSTVRRDGERPL